MPIKGRKKIITNLFSKWDLPMIQYYYYFMIFIIIEFESSFFFFLLPLRFEVFFRVWCIWFWWSREKSLKNTSRKAADNDKIDSFPTWNYFPPDRIGFFCAVFANIDLLVITVSVTTFKHWVKVKQNYLSRFNLISPSRNFELPPFGSF